MSEILLCHKVWAVLNRHCCPMLGVALPRRKQQHLYPGYAAIITASMFGFKRAKGGAQLNKGSISGGAEPRLTSGFV